MNPAALIDLLEHFQRRVIQDAFAEASAAYWRRRAEAFRDARPRLEEFHGAASREELREAWLSCDRLAQACEFASQVALVDAFECDLEEILSELGEGA